MLHMQKAAFAIFLLSLLSSSSGEPPTLTDEDWGDSIESIDVEELERTIAEAKALKEAKQEEKVAGGTDYSNSPSGYSIDYGSINNAINILSSLVGNDLKKTKGGRKLKTKEGPNESKEKKEGEKGSSSEGGNERENEKGKVGGKTKAKKKEKNKKTKGELKIKTKGPEELTQHWIKPMFKEKKGREDSLSLAISYGGNDYTLANEKERVDVLKTEPKKKEKSKRQKGESKIKTKATKESNEAHLKALKIQSKALQTQSQALQTQSRAVKILSKAKEIQLKALQTKSKAKKIQ